jgi:hypothetical protein
MIKVYGHRSAGTCATTAFKLEAENVTQVTQTKQFNSSVSILKSQTNSSTERITRIAANLPQQCLPYSLKRSQSYFSNMSLFLLIRVYDTHVYFLNSDTLPQMMNTHSSTRTCDLRFNKFANFNQLSLLSKNSGPAQSLPHYFLTSTTRVYATVPQFYSKPH